MSHDIRNFEELIKPILTVEQRLVSYNCQNLLTTGENYGSIMLKVEVKTTDKSGQENILHCVAKTCPPPGILWEIFSVKTSFKKEIAIYTTVIPTLNDFGKERGVDCIMDFFAKSMGARISLDPNSDEVDADAALLLENLKVQGYDIGDRFTGFDEASTRYLLRDLAAFHAAPIAYRSAKPEEFRAKILPHLKKDFNFKPKENVVVGITEKMQDAVSRNPNCVPYLSKIEDAMRRMEDSLKNPIQGKDIFATIVHNDYWVNNTMLKYKDGQPTSNKIVDFQIIDYGSLAHDVVFFLYSSVNLSVLESKIDELLKFYYDEFTAVLVKLQHDISEYSFEAIMEEFALVAKDSQFSHVLFMLSPIMTLKGKAVELAELNEESLLTDEGVLHQNYYSKIQFVLLDFVKRGWV